MNNHFQPLLDKLSLKFINADLLMESFTHRSYLNEGGKNRASNERLEFLGDAILSFLVSHHLFTLYPDLPEGKLTNFRSTIVKTETLSMLAGELAFGKYLLLSKGEEKGGGRTNSSLLADTFEAFLGAVFLDQGLDAAKQFLSQVLYPRIADILKTQLHSDYKSALQEIVQVDSNMPPVYKVVKTDGPDHAKTFWVVVVIDGKEYETGEGKSKQEAEQQAARLTLVRWRNK